MSISLALPTEELLNNVRRQVKRLRTSINLPHKIAQDILAKAVYQCSSWNVLIKRIESGENTQDSLILLLNADSKQAKNYLSQHVLRISEAFGHHIDLNISLDEMCRQTRFILGEEQNPNSTESNLSDVFSSLKILPWQKSGIGPDPDAVLETYTVINGVTIKLIATRCYLPAYLKLDNKLQRFAHHADIPGAPFKIMWSDPEAWRQAAIEFLSVEEDEDFGESPNLPRIPYNRHMSAHARWFYTMLSYWRDCANYSAEDDKVFRPIHLEHGHYIVFGMASSLPFSYAAPANVILEEPTDGNHQVALLDKQPICIEWLPVNWDHDGRYNADAYSEPVKSRIFDYSDFDSSNYQGRRWFCVLPINDEELRYALTAHPKPGLGYENLTLNTNNIPLAQQILSKILAGDLTTYTDRNLARLWVLRLDVPISQFKLAFGVTYQNYRDDWWASQLFCAVKSGGVNCVYLSMRQVIFTLMHAIGQKKFLDALRYRLVINLPEGFCEAHQNFPQWCLELPITPLEHRFF